MQAVTDAIKSSFPCATAGKMKLQIVKKINPPYITLNY